jgi:multiple sugar transport system ATP-binding protein
MNLVSGDIENGVFSGPGMTIGGLQSNVRGPVTLGFRAEDATLVSEGGELGAEIYSMELLGEATMASFKIGDQLVSIKSGKEYRAEIGNVVHASIPASICHLFDARTGGRIARTPGN